MTASCRPTMNEAPLLSGPDLQMRAGFRQRYFLLLLIAVFLFITFLTEYYGNYFNMAFTDSEKYDYYIDLEGNEDCACPSSSPGKYYDFCYRLPENRTVHGFRFNCSFVEIVERLGLLPDSTNLTHRLINLKKEDMPPPVFVTAFSENHAREGRKSIERIRYIWPQQKIILYDLGITEALSQFVKIPNLEIRRFNFSQYPSYFSKLTEFRWKPIIIAKTLAEFGAIWYLDSSIVFKKNDLSHVYDLVRCHRNVSKRVNPKLASVTEGTTTLENGWNRERWDQNVRECRKSAYLLHGFSGHGIYPATNPGVYKWIPTNMAELRKGSAGMYDAGFVFAVWTRETIENILLWYVLCALQERCMAPRGATLGCSFKNDRYAEYADCHRYDQSVVNLLAANSYQYERRNYVSEIVDFFDIERGFD
ncbi:unnamed protein product [Caenorhabditis auriculariae]|uniref:Nucleotide-diphospho-sugar transferase domain-containing protein n=1 Tax=Caenorhabditis auriculariae TaxID=2777116 RepID=A0A8S1H6H8_9PELO|nr:unnamed protein product [Caenorhabditis auriculariae]